MITSCFTFWVFGGFCTKAWKRRCISPPAHVHWGRVWPVAVPGVPVRSELGQSSAGGGGRSASMWHWGAGSPVPPGPGGPRPAPPGSQAAVGRRTLRSGLDGHDFGTGLRRRARRPPSPAGRPRRGCGRGGIRSPQAALFPCHTSSGFAAFVRHPIVWLPFVGLSALPAFHLPASRAVFISFVWSS